MPKQKSNTLLFASALFLILIFLDQFTKYLARNYLTEPVQIIKNIFHLTLVKNTGSLFGLLQNTNVYLIWFSVIALGFIIYYYDSFPKKRIPKLLILIITAGIIGNLIDRILFGYVIDFIDLRIWPVFNIADSMITIGVIGLLLYSFWAKE